MKKIMIVEDTSVLKIRLENILRRNALTEIESYDSKKFRASYSPQLLKEAELFIVDLDTPFRNGIQIIEEIKAADTQNEAKIMGMSKDPDIALLKKAVIAGCDDLLIKPFNGDVFVHKVKKIMGMKAIEENSPNHISAVDIDEEGDGNLRWNVDFEIDVKEIDDEHKDIIDKYEKLYTLMKDGKGHQYYPELLSFLNDYVNTHFSHEQGIHAKEDYPLRVEHISIHEAFKASVFELYQKGLENEITDIDLIKINLFIKNWLIHHILIEDRKFGRFLNEKKN